MSELHLLPPGSISTHVRHGLKITEAPLFPFEARGLGFGGEVKFFPMAFWNKVIGSMG